MRQYQGKSRRWLRCLCIMTAWVIVGAQNGERSRLLRFFEKSDGARWVVNTGWNTTELFCSWYGITCDSDGLVTEINLPSNGLSGIVARVILDLPKLTHLNLFNNHLVDGGFDGFKKTQSLERLNLAQNNIKSIPPGIANAPDSLKVIHMTKNQLKGRFPHALTKLSSLEALFLSFNKLHGSLPTLIGDMKALKELFLFGNLITGQLPTEIGRLDKLEYFTVAENALTGTIPTEVENMVNLQTFSLHHKLGEGKLRGRVPTFPNAPFLTEIYLNGNQLEGSIPTSLLKHSNRTNQLVSINLKDNQITGTVPLSLQKFDKLNLDLTNNQISGIPDPLCQKSRWMAGLVGQYGCDALLCPSGTANVDGRQSTDDQPCLPCAGGMQDSPYFGLTRCGEAPPLSELQVLALLYTALGGKDWTVADGWAVLDQILQQQTIEELGTATTTEYCDLFFGITCNAEKQIVNIELSNNGLIGEIPSELFSLPVLHTLDLSRNTVGMDSDSGFAPLAKSTSLKKLDLSGTKISDLKGIGGAQSLESLILDGVELGANMPTELFELTDLKRLSTMYAYFEGALTTLIGKMTGMTELNMYSNELTGSIPSEVGLLTNLRILDLSQNKFIGDLPTQLNALSKLEKLHLQQTEGALRGELPSFNTFPDLVELTLDSNSFSGSIPSDFLSGVDDKNRPMLVGLSYNNIVGSTPKDLKAFESLNIRLEGNKITNIPIELCSKPLWMDGEVGKVGSCDAILCPAKTWNLYGKASSKLNATCLPCPGNAYFGSTVCGDDLDPNPEKTILDSLYRLTGGQYWESAVNWTTPGVGICYREGIECDDTGDQDSGVVAIRLENMGLQGLIPPEVFDLPQCGLLDFTNNEVELSFIGIEKATKLRELKMSNTKVRTLDNLGNSPSTLKEIHLANNEITGTISPEILELQSVEYLFLGNNLFSGSIPEEITQLSSLKRLLLWTNRLTGTLPTELGLMSNLEEVDLAGNLLVGFLPTELGELSNLRKLSLAEQRGDKKLSGPVFPFFSNPELVELDLSFNSFRGIIPRTLLSSVNKGSNITVNLSHNDMTGGVPIDLNHFDSLTIILDSNKIDALPQQLCDGNNPDWMGGNVGAFSTCDAILCPPGTALSSGRQIKANEECSPCPNGVQDAKYYGSTECNAEVIRTERDVLEALYNHLNGTGWIDQTNWMSERNVCTWFGIKCSDSAPGIVEISLESNNLEGEGDGVSSLLFSLRNLKHLSLKDNPVPLNLKKIPNTSELLTLKLSGTGLKSLEGVSRARNLHRLHVTNNGLTGAIPDELFDLTNLRALYLSFNLLSSVLSPEIGKLSNLQEFYVFDNMISGSIPTEVGLLTNIREFVMPQNLLTGTLPSLFGSMTNLEQLSLYDQKGDTVLSGTLPTFEGAPKLWYFDATRNDMFGPIPDDFMKNSIYTNQSVTVYMSYNDLTGTIPASLDRFEILDLGVVGNRFISIPPTLCDNALWMQNAVGAIKSCDAILCAKGSYSASGRQEVPGSPCLPCNEGLAKNFLGQTECGNVGVEKEILKLVYTMTGGENWKNKEKWNSDSPICSWAGIVCTNGEANDDNGVTSLILANNNLSGTLPALVFQLPMLEVLKVEENPDLFVSLDGLFHAQRLQTLYLSEVQMDNIEGVSQATSLRNLHLTGNGLTGSLPEELYDMHSLEGIFIAFNAFSGTLSSRIGELSNLINFYAFDNDISGTLPTECGSLSSLHHFVISENLISGLIPTELSTMPNLKLLSLYRRFKSGPKLTGPLPPFHKVPQLTDLYLDNNWLTGPIPQHFLSSSTHASLILLNQNRLEGTVPAELDFLKAVDLQVVGNKIADFPDEFCDNNAWMNGAIGEIGCNAFLCPPHTANILGRANATLPCESCPTDDTAEFFGSVSCEEQFSQRRILIRLYQSCGGTSWHKNDKWTSDEDICGWHGITCDPTGSVTQINLSSNNVVGTPKPDLFTLPDLQVLALSSNPIEFSFDNIGSAQNLFELRLDSTGLDSVVGISKASTLRILSLKYNSLAGGFPDELLELKNLNTLDIGNNALSGPLPASFGALRYLRTLRLGSNSLSGRLPAFEDMNALVTIDLSENELEGTIPASFLKRVSSVAEAIVVNLSANRLSGTVPEELARFERLTIYLRENRIESLPPFLCSNENWNGGDVGKYGCDGILCPPGTFSYIGRQSDGETRCRSCSDWSPYYGSVTCSSSSSTRIATALSALFAGGLLLVIAL